MPITKTVEVRYVLIAMAGSMTGGDAVFTFQRFDDNEPVGTVAVPCPFESFGAMLQEGLPSDKAGYPLGYYLADKIMAWCVANGHLTGTVS